MRPFRLVILVVIFFLLSNAYFVYIIRIPEVNVEETLTSQKQIDAIDGEFNHAFFHNDLTNILYSNGSYSSYSFVNVYDGDTRILNSSSTGNGLPLYLGQEYIHHL